jgi:hypothetical protein
MSGSFAGTWLVHAFMMSAAPAQKQQQLRYIGR